MKFLGMDPTLGLADELNNHVKAESEAARIIEESGFYRANCPRCGRRQVRVSLLSNGCFVCNWQGTEEEIELSRIGQPVQNGQSDASGRAGVIPYRTTCPNCSAQVLTEQLMESGCYVCGYKPG